MDMILDMIVLKKDDIYFYIFIVRQYFRLEISIFSELILGIFSPEVLKNSSMIFLAVRDVFCL